MKNKVIICVVILVLLLVIVSCWCLLKGKNTPIPPRGNNSNITEQGTKNGNVDENNQVVVDENNINDVYENPQNYSDNMYSIPTEKITVADNVIKVAEASIAEINDNMTILTMQIVNQTNEVLSKDAILNIELTNAEGVVLGTIGGVIEEDEDLEPGASTIVKTQFLDRIVGISGMKISVGIPE